MQLFSKRYSIENLTTSVQEDGSFISPKLRERLVQQIKYLTDSKEYIEPFLLVKDETSGNIYIHEESLRELGKREMGYELTDLIDCKSRQLTDDGLNNDFALFDLLEILIIFSIKEQRDGIVARFSKILSEENSDFAINEFMFVYKKETGLKAITPLLKDPNLREKLESIYNAMLTNSDYESLARQSADLVQFLFSSPDGQKTKEFSNDLCRNVAKKWTESSKVEKLVDLLDDEVKQTKRMNNEVEDIRHTDRYTIPTEGYTFFKLIFMNNLSIIELVIQSLPSDYIFSEDPESIKKEYWKEYSIIESRSWIIKKIDEEDIPF